MSFILIRLPAAGVIALALLTNSPLIQARLYRWVDENGKVFYADQIPPEFNKYKRAALDEKARVVETTAAEKPDDQKNLEQRLARLRTQQEKLIAEQKAKDAVLLKTFHGEKDLQQVLKSQLKSIETQKRVSLGNLRRLQYQLRKQQKKAADYERLGKKISVRLLAEIHETEQQIKHVQKEINLRDQEIQKTKLQFAKDLKRFRVLMQKKAMAKNATTDSGTGKLQDMPGVFVCKDENQCASAWEIARLYVQNHSTTRIELDSKKLILTPEPEQDNDISLSISKIKNDDGMLQIFLDIKCKASKKGRQLCSSDKVYKIRSGFNPFVKMLLSPD